MTTAWKILRADEWAAFLREGGTDGAPVDLADGFVHLSTSGQVRETARRHFAGEAGLKLLLVDLAGFGPALKWEPSRGGALFPHLYARLPADAVLAVHDLPLTAEGHAFPDAVP